MKDKIIRFIPLAVAITCVCGLIYLAGQQNYRMTANDPQIQFAQDIAASLNGGTTPQSIIPPSKIDMSKSLGVFIIIFDKNGKMTLSTGEIAGKVPDVPSGVFDSVSKNGEERITWQPQSGVRMASVVTKYKDGYVLVGRSLKEVEKRENQLLMQVGLGWIVTLILTFITKVFFASSTKTSRKA